MSSKHRLRMVVLAATAIAVGLLANTASAAKWQKTAKLRAVGDEPNAFGQATMSYTQLTDLPPFKYRVLFKLSCAALTPGQTYEAQIPGIGKPRFVADANGNFAWEMVVETYGLPYRMGVYRVTTTGESVLVLWGTFH